MWMCNKSNESIAIHVVTHHLAFKPLPLAFPIPGNYGRLPTASSANVLGFKVEGCEERSMAGEVGKMATPERMGNRSAMPQGAGEVLFGAVGVYTSLQMPSEALERRGAVRRRLRRTRWVYGCSTWAHGHMIGRGESRARESSGQSGQ